MPDAESSVQAPPVPLPLAGSLQARSLLGLSPNEQVVSIPRAGLATRKRINKLRVVTSAAADAIRDDFQHGGRRFRVAMVTLTYRPGVEYEARQISKLIDHYRQWLRRRGAAFHGLWVIELQKRGAPHYHLLLWLPRGLTPPKPDKQGWWPHGSTRAEWARSPVGYLQKYASKGERNQATLPKGARLFGIYGCRRNLGWWRAPAWLRDFTRPGWRIVRRPGGWWCVEQLARAWKSPWQVWGIDTEFIRVRWVGWTPADVRSLWELGY